MFFLFLFVFVFLNVSLPCPVLHCLQSSPIQAVVGSSLSSIKIVTGTVSLTLSTTVLGVNLAVAQSAAFQTVYIAAIASATGVSSSLITIGTITASPSGRRLLTGNYIPIIMKIAADLVAKVTSRSSNSGSEITIALAPQFPTVIVGNPLVSVAASDSVTSPTYAPSMASPTVFNAGTVATSANGQNTNPSCFAGTELVTLESGGDKQMSEVRMGDRILTVNAKGEQVFSDVVYLPHGANQDRATFTVLTTESGRDLKMTADHFLPAGACATPSTLSVIAASQVVVGDCVQTVSGREQVVSVGKVEGKGIYTVIAMEELIVVNGIVATPYGGVNPTVANIYYNIYRLVYTLAYQGKMTTTLGWVQGATEGLWGMLSLSLSR